MVFERGEIYMDEWVELEWVERCRSYYFPEGNVLEIPNVVAVKVKESGTHRLRTADGKLWVIPTGWLGIELDTEGNFDG